MWICPHSFPCESVRTHSPVNMSAPVNLSALIPLWICPLLWICPHSGPCESVRAHSALTHVLEGAAHGARLTAPLQPLGQSKVCQLHVTCQANKHIWWGSGGNAPLVPKPTIGMWPVNQKHGTCQSNRLGDAQWETPPWGSWVPWSQSPTAACDPSIKCTWPANQTNRIWWSSARNAPLKSLSSSVSKRNSCTRLVNQITSIRSGNSSVLRAPDLWFKGLFNCFPLPVSRDKFVTNLNETFKTSIYSKNRKHSKQASTAKTGNKLLQTKKQQNSCLLPQSES